MLHRGSQRVREFELGFLVESHTCDPSSDRLQILHYCLTQPDLKEDETIGYLVARFLDNHLFREFFKSYIQIRLTETPFNLIIARHWTFAQLMEDFHTTVVGMLSDEIFLDRFKKPLKNHELEALRSDLETWKSFALHVPDISRSAFDRALKNCGFPIS